MNEWLDANADGLALMLWMLIGLIVALCAAGAVEWLRARPSREWVRSIRRGEVTRQRMATDHKPLPRPTWTPPSGWVHDR